MIGHEPNWRDKEVDAEKKLSSLIELIDVDKFLALRIQALTYLRIVQYNELIGKFLGYPVTIQINIDERIKSSRSVDFNE